MGAAVLLHFLLTADCRGCGVLEFSGSGRAVHVPIQVTDFHLRATHSHYRSFGTMVKHTSISSVRSSFRTGIHGEDWW
ncbi:hypothetical protein F5Y18DRAFT_179654 [Xylariaceae sp. FL1019]|nr:hypothetical protein F5Y18DRAFT_179654 [Xylariaceae sp. FL1019]